MKTLAIENSTHVGTIALAESDRIVALKEILKSGALSVAIRDLILEFGPPDEIVVGIGPGSYTGIRVAVAMVIGLSTGLRCRTYGCPSVLAYDAATYHVVGDARRDSVFLASVEENRMTRPPELHSLDEFHLLLAQLRTKPVFAVGPVPGVTDLPTVLPRADRFLSRRDWFQPSLEPIYLKEPHITQTKG